MGGPGNSGIRSGCIPASGFWVDTMSEPYDNRFDGYLGWNDDEEYAQFQRDYDKWVESHLEGSIGETSSGDRGARSTAVPMDSPSSVEVSSAHLDAMDRLGRKP